MSELGLSLAELAGQPLELFAREGARLVLTVVLEEEVTCFLQRCINIQNHISLALLFFNVIIAYLYN